MNSFDSKEWLKIVIEVMKPTEEEIALERVFKRIMAQLDPNGKWRVELVKNVPPVIFDGEESDVETAMAEYEKWAQELEDEMPIELDPGFDKWAEEQIELFSKSLERIEMLPERSN